MTTLRDREDVFIKACKKEFGSLTPESEMLLRYGYAAGASELNRVAYKEGTHDQRERVLDALGAASREEHPLP